MTSTGTSPSTNPAPTATADTADTAAPRPTTAVPAPSLLRRHAALGAVLVLQAALALGLRNTAFQDEALYLVHGHWYLDAWSGGPAVTTGPEGWFTGAPQLYPVLAAVLDAAGGLGLVRFFALVCLMSATVAVHWAANTLFGRPGQVRTGVLAALVFVASGPVLVLSHLATLDAPSLAALAWALAIGVWAASAPDRNPWWAVLVGVLLASAVLVKYVSALDVPFVLAVVLLVGLGGTGTGSWRPGPVTAVIAGFTALGVLSLNLTTWGIPLIAGVRDSTVDREGVSTEPASQLVARLVAEGGWGLALSVLGGLLLVRRRPLLGAVVLVASVAAPVAQVVVGEPVSLYKSTVLGLLFGAPLAGHLLVQLGRRPWGLGVAAVALFGALVSGAAVAERIYTSWPDTSALAQALRPLVGSGDQRVAGENPEPLQYALREQTRPQDWSPLYDNSYRYQGLAGEEGLRAALADRRYDVVFFEGATAMGRQVQPDMEALGYEQAAVVAATDGSREWVVWRAA